MCSFAGINIWPQQQFISTNSIFVIEGFSHSQNLIRELNKKNKIYLTCGTELIGIQIVKILKGQFSLTQAILKPEQELSIGKTYELHIDSLDRFDKNEFKTFKWTVNNSADKETPSWRNEPSYKGKNYTAFGCGPEKYVNFCGNYSDNSPTLIYAKVFDKTKNTSSDYFLTSNNDNLALGHGMCSGEFSFDKETKYEVQFGLMDASGNENFNMTEPISFTSPTKENNSEDLLNCNCKKRVNYITYSLIGLTVLGFGIFKYKRRKNASS